MGMTTTQLRTTVDVSRDRIEAYGCFVDRWNGFGVVVDKDTSSKRITLMDMDYEDVCVGDVFVVCEDLDYVDMDHASVFEMKMPVGNWYLTGDVDMPLGVNRNEYGRVWVVA